MSISVIMTTASMGGLDMLFNSLAAQADPPEFEVVIADEWYHERNKFLKFPWNVSEDILSKFNDRVKHVPITKRVNYIDHCNGWNTGLRAAEGELVCFINDYFWLYPNYLRDHWDIYKRYSGYSMIGYCDRYPWPAMKLSVKTEDVWWTAFQQEFTAERAAHYFQCTHPIYHERKGGHQGEPVPGCPFNRLPGSLFYASLNESIPMAVLKELNGWDERYDGGYASNDVDLGVRAELVGWKFLLNPTVNCKIGMYGIQRPVHTLVKPQVRSPQDNHQLFKDRMWKVASGQEPARVPAGHGAWE